MKKLKEMLIVAATATVTALSANAATFDGYNVNAAWNFPTFGSPYDDYGNAVVGETIEFPNLDVDGVVFFSLNLGESNITVSFLSGGGFTNAGFNGLVISSLSGLFPTLSVASITANGFDFTASDVIIEEDRVGLNFTGDSFVGGEFVTVSFAPDVAPIPLPASVLLLGLGLAGLGVMRKRSKV